MDRELFSLAVQGTLRKKRSSLLVFFVLLLSFAFAIVSLSLMGSLTKTNAEFRMETYGAWYYAMPAGLDKDAAALRSIPGVKQLGTMRNYGTLNGAGFGTVDADMREVGRLKVDQGRWPEAEGEIALEADLLSLMDYDYTLGQEITAMIAVPCGEESVLVQQTFTLCGIVHEFSNLWVLNENRDSRLLVSAIVTEETAERMLEAAAEAAAGQELAAGPDQAFPQYFLLLRSNDEGTIDLAGDALSDYLWETQEERSSRLLSTNEVILEASAGGVPNGMYLAMIASVALVAVLCVYLMQLPASVQSFATLRSIGMTRPQLLQLVMLETLLLLVPAVVLGVPCGAALTWLALRLLAFSESFSIKVAIPYGELLWLAALWLAVVAAARLLLFAVAVRVPLTGRFRLQRGKAKHIRWLRGGLIAVLLCVFGMALILPERESRAPKKLRDQYAEQIHYTFSRIRNEPGVRGSIDQIVPQTAVDALRSIPGIDWTASYSYGDIGLSFAGMEERSTQILAINEDEWEAVLDFGEDREAFRAGELVLLCFPDEGVPDNDLSDYGWPEDEWCYLRPGEDLSSRDYCLPDGEVELYFYDRDRTLLTRTSTPVSIRRISTNYLLYGRSLMSPYLVVCSSAYLQAVLAQMEPGSNWNPGDRTFDRSIRQYGHTAPPSEFIADEEFGYMKVYAHADRYANNNLTDNLIASLCKEQGLILMNNRAVIMAKEQGEIQKIVMYYAMGACIALMALLVLAGALSLETEQEMRSFSTLRAIGMSKRQMWARVSCKALGRSLLAGAGGWALYVLYAAAGEIYFYANPPAFNLEPTLISPARALRIVLNSIEMPEALRLGGVCVAAAFVLMLVAKRRVGKGEITI